MANASDWRSPEALALQPSVLIIDEALSNLDALNQALILELLAELQDSQSLAYLHISHDLRLVSQFADEVAVDARWTGSWSSKKTRELFASPEHSYTEGTRRHVPFRGVDLAGEGLRRTPR